MKTNHSISLQQYPKRGRNALIALISVAAGLLPVSDAQAAGKSARISSVPYIIAEPGTYTLAQDLVYSRDLDDPEAAIAITASKVDLNLGGHTLSGDGTGYGIYVDGQADVHIHHGAVQGFQIGVVFGGALNCSLNHVAANQNTMWGIAGRGAAAELTITDNTASQNVGTGIMLDSDSRHNTVAHNTANQNGEGIFIGNGAFANSVTGNTASGNWFAGISIFDSSDNTVSDNTTTDNGDRGINLVNAHDNTVARNTTERNSTGIHISDGSYRNLVARNSVTSNYGEGIRLLLGATDNTVQDNRITGSWVGIVLGLVDVAQDNLIQGNRVILNVLGIWVELGSTDNTIQGNTALDNRDYDLGDLNPGCDSNTWAGNEFETDWVEGTSDGGPDTGCIQ